MSKKKIHTERETASEGGSQISRERSWDKDEYIEEGKNKGGNLARSGGH